MDDLRKSRSHRKGILTRLKNELKELVWDLNNTDELRNKVNQLEEALRKFYDVHQQYYWKTNSKSKTLTSITIAKNEKLATCFTRSMSGSNQLNKG